MSKSPVAWYLMASYAYYWQDDPIMSDAAYDALCKDLDARWDSIEHPHKYLIDRDWLKAGSCLLPRLDYPNMAVNAIISVRETGDQYE